MDWHSVGAKQGRIRKPLLLKGRPPQRSIAGFLPLIIEGGGFWPPLAITIAGGVVGATLLALVLVPSAYLIVIQLVVRPVESGIESAENTEPTLVSASVGALAPVLLFFGAHGKKLIEKATSVWRKARKRRSSCSAPMEWICSSRQYRESDHKRDRRNVFCNDSAYKNTLENDLQARIAKLENE